MILVTGASGYIGSRVASRLILRGHDVLAMVRDKGTGRRCLPPATSVRVADYEDHGDLEAAFSGVDYLVLISSDGFAADVTRHHADAINAAVDARVGHILFTSIIDIDEASPFYFAPVYRDAESRLKACGIPTNILRCGLYSDFIVNNWLTPAATTGELLLPANEGWVAPISRDDVADAIVAAVTSDGHCPEVASLTGCAVTLHQVTRDYGGSTGRQLLYKPCTEEEYFAKASAILDAPWPKAFASLALAISQGRFAHESPDFAEITGRQPERFRSFAQRLSSKPLSKG